MTGRPPLIRSRGASYALGAATLWPVVYLVFFIGVSIVLVVTQPASGDGGLPGWFVALAVLHVLTILLGFGLLATYLVDLFRNPRTQGTDERVLWVLLVVLVPPSMLVYWWLHLRPASASFRERLGPPAR